MAARVAELWLLLLLAVSATGNLSQFYSIIRKVGGIDPTKLVTYGCYCGLGNTNNNKVVDCLDKCCFFHDNCIAKLKNPCPHQYSLGSFAGYTLNDSLQCVSDQEECPYRLCQCDYEFGICVSKYKSLHKNACIGVKSEVPCIRQANYTIPDCENEVLEDMIEQTRNVCFVPEVGTTTSQQMSTVTTSTIKPPTTTISTSTATATTEEAPLNISSPQSQSSSSASRCYLHKALLISLLTLFLAPILLA